MMQELIVGLIVAYAFWIVARRYAPKTVRRFARRSIVQAARKTGWAALAERFEQAAEDDASCGSGCGKCGACDTGGTPQASEKIVAMPAPLKGSSRPS